MDIFYLQEFFSFLLFFRFSGVEIFVRAFTWFETIFICKSFHCFNDIQRKLFLLVIFTFSIVYIGTLVILVGLFPHLFW